MSTNGAASGDLGRMLLRTAQDLAVLGQRVEQLDGMASQVAELRERVGQLPSGDALTEVFGELSSNLQALADRLSSLEAAATPDDDKAKVWDFTRLQGAARDAAWQQLVSWVHGVLGDWYHCLASENGDVTALDSSDRAPKIPWCWQRHSDLVLDLSWLCQEWQRVMKGTDPAKVGDWHDRYLPGFRRRLRDSSAADCLTRGHPPDPPAGY